jgi:hypothetical protein
MTYLNGFMAGKQEVSGDNNFAAIRQRATPPAGREEPGSGTGSISRAREGRGKIGVDLVARV